MSWISLTCFAISGGTILSMLRREADPLSPARIFCLVWSLAIGLAELKLSRLQHEWSFDSWVLLLTGIGAFLVGTFIAYAVNINRRLVPINDMRRLLRQEKVLEGRLFWVICFAVLVYGGAFLANYLLRGWIPILVLGTNISRVDFNISGLTLFLYSATFIIFFTLLYYLMVPGKRGRKLILTIILVVVIGSFFLLVIRYPIIMTVMICFVLLYYVTRHIRLRTLGPLLVLVIAFFYWISSIRLSHVVSTFLYYTSKMKFSKDFAFFTEPYMYVVMNLENFARSVDRLDHHTYGYFTFDFITAIVGLKYWVYEYFSLERSPYLVSGYNTYTAFWWFYMDFGAIGLGLISLLLGLCTGVLYYRMRASPTIKRVTAYGVMVFVMFISYFNFPLAFLWFNYNLVAMYFIMRWTIIPGSNERESGTRSLHPA